MSRQGDAGTLVGVYSHIRHHRAVARKDTATARLYSRLARKRHSFPQKATALSGTPSVFSSCPQNSINISLRKLNNIIFHDS